MTMDLEVVGRHALLFDDDALSAFVNSGEALVDWNSLQIDRYDVRHLLSSPPPPRRRRHPLPPSSDPSIESQLDRERYLDLPPPSVLPEVEDEDKAVDSSSYHSVAFSYGNADDVADKRNDAEGIEGHGFSPSFPVPESLHQSLPPTEKMHQIISRTALFVSKHGGQSEIILRVKQGDNPTFGFLMPDHHLHAYFRFLVDHPELLLSEVDGEPQKGKSRAGNDHKSSDAVGGALTLLGSLYGSGEDEDGVTEDRPESNRSLLGGEVSAVGSQASVRSDLSTDAHDNNKAVYKHLDASPKEKPSAVKKNPSISTLRAGNSTTMKKVDSSSSCSSTAEKSKTSSMGPLSAAEPLIVQPPSDMKKTIDKIVDFIVKNGKQFELTLAEQDRKHGRFPFLLQSNLYHPYYSMVLQKVQELKRSGKSSLCRNDDAGLMLQSKASLSGAIDSVSFTTASDMPFESDRKEKFKMVLTKSKKDGQDPPSRVTSQEFEVGLDAAAAAAILQAATRGIKNPNIGHVSSIPLNCKSNDQSIDGVQSSSSGKLNLFQPNARIHNQNGGPSASISAAEHNAICAEVAGEADSSEAHLTKEEKLKAERRKRAKMFVAMLKSGAPTEAVHERGSHMELQASPELGSGVEVNLPCKEREGSSAPPDISDQNEIPDQKNFNDEINERRLKRKYRSRSGRDDGEDESDEKHPSHVEDEELEMDREGRMHSKRKKHRSDDSARTDKDCKEDEEKKNHKRSRRKHRTRHSYEEDSDGKEDSERHHNHHKSSRRKHSSHRSSREGDEGYNEEEGEHSRKKKRSSHRSDDRRHRKRHSSRDKESRPEPKHDNLDNECHGQKVSSLEELEEGEILAKFSDQSRESGYGRVSREASLGVSQPSDPPDVSDDFRAKIRAMLMATR